VSGYVPADLQRRVRARFSDCCAYCHTAEELTVAVFELEHIVPRCAGGKTVFKNLCLACPTCNRFKANRTAAYDPVTQENAPLFHPQHERWTDHFHWSADATVIVALTPTGRATISALRMNRPQLVRVRRMWVAMGEHPPQHEPRR
jgi:hypothetical protein